MTKDSKKEFITFLKTTGALKYGQFTLKSKRSSPYFVNVGDFCSGPDIKRLGEAYAGELAEQGLIPDLIFGPSYKGSAIAIATATALSDRGQTGHKVEFAYDRKEAKTHGEMTGANLQKAMLVGGKVNASTRIVIVDDVMTTAETKYEALQLLVSCGANPENILAVLVAVDRQEVAVNGANAIQEFTAKTGVPVISILTAEDILKDAGSDNYLTHYVLCYGTTEAQKSVKESPWKTLHVPQRSIVPACDVFTLNQLSNIAKATKDEPRVGAYKLGFQLGLQYGLPALVETIRQHTTKPIIYDHQKAGTDIPDTGRAFAQVCAGSGIDSVILFPQAGPETERAWIYAALNEGLHVIIGGRMTHPAYAVSEGGFITDEGAMQMYRIAIQCGVTDFVVPGNKLEVIQQVQKMFFDWHGSDTMIPTFWAPGFVSQGGKIEEAAKVAGPQWHAIVGRAICEGADNVDDVAERVAALCSGL